MNDQRAQQGARERLVYHVQRLEGLEAAKQAASEALRDAFDSAKRGGFDPATLKVVLRLRKLTPAERKERRALEAIYLAALGMLEGDPLPDEARRLLDEEGNTPPKAERGSGREAGPKEAKPGKSAPAPAPSPAPPPPQLRMPLKDPEEARKEGREAASAGKRVYDNPFPAGDPCRAAWDEGWCEKRKSHGMETPAAYQRRTKAPEAKKPPSDSEKKGAA